MKGDISQVFPPSQYYFALGSVGWGQNDASYYDLGTASNGGRTLIHVSLAWGRSPTEKIDNTRLQGVKIVAQLCGPLYAIPPLNAIVPVGVPDKMWRMPGACCVWAVAMPSPSSGFDANNMQIPIGNGQNILLGDANAIYVALAQKVDALFSTLQTAFNNHVHNLSGSPTTIPITNPAIKVPLWDGSSGAAASTAATKVKAT